ncbi:PAS domain-containing protein [Desulfovibrio litoralis]|uniref:PAS domain S-box-containing protein n=1 Tax=Desulfovibrio litoralis DSM 11393 TaxID=1121455 RepID=A0A1M7TID6_9BACT|nr:PAS domain-containing protein [Desulfovibrio litoralis]SHN70441.1 PAS domain S-box-containing protein [Desulfovibrio litoralis DSM 11393]
MKLKSELKKASYPQIGKKLYFIFFFITLSCILALFSYLIKFQNTAVNDSLKSKGSSVVRLIANTSAEHLLGSNYFYIEDMLESLVESEPDLAYAFILDENAQVVAHTFQTEFPIDLWSVHNSFTDTNMVNIVSFVKDNQKEVLSFATSVLIANDRIGTAVVAFYPKTFLQTLLQVNLWHYSIFFVILFIMMGAGFIVTKALRQELRFSLQMFNDAMEDLPPLIHQNIISAEWQLEDKTCVSPLDFYRSFLTPLQKARRYFYMLDNAVKSNDSNEAIINTLGQHLTNMIILYDKTGRVIYMNEACVNFFGVDRKKFINKYPDEVVISKLGVITRTENDAILHGTPPIFKETLYEYEDKKINFSVKRLPIYTKKGDLTNILTILTDISPEKECFGFNNLSNVYNFALLTGQHALSQINASLTHILQSVDDNQTQPEQLKTELNTVLNHASELESKLLNNVVVPMAINIQESISAAAQPLETLRKKQGLIFNINILEEMVIVSGSEYTFNQIWKSIFLSVLLNMDIEKRPKALLNCNIRSNLLNDTVTITLECSCDNIFISTPVNEDQIKSIEPFDQGDILPQDLIEKMITAFGGSLVCTSEVSTNAFSEEERNSLKDSLGHGSCVKITLNRATTPSPVIK